MKVVLKRISPKVWVYIETVTVAVFLVLLGIFLAHNAGGPVNSDEVMYINHGLTNVKDTFVINRYTHIYFQKLFMSLAPDPFAGVKDYWAFIITGTTGLIYLISRLITKSSNFIIAGISALLYLAIPLIAANSGNTAVDFTAGFFLALTVLAYLLYFRSEKKQVYLLSLFGLMFFLAFRSKETTLALVILFIGFLFDLEGKFNFRLFLKRFLWVMIGVGAGVILFAVLNGIILKDALFGLRLSDYSLFKESYIDKNIAEETKKVANWFTKFLFVSIPYLFVAYIISGVKRVKEQERSLQLIWILPLVSILILSIIIGYSKWGVVERHIFPALPIICAIAPQFIFHDKLTTKKDVLILLGVGVVVLVVAFVGRVLLMKVSTFGPYNYPDFLASTVYPITLIVLLALVFFKDRYSLVTMGIPLLIMLIFLRLPLTENYNSISKSQPNVDKMTERLAVFKAFDGDVRILPDQEILLFAGPLKNLNKSSRLGEFIGLYNMYFNEQITSKNVIFTEIENYVPGYIEEEQPDYILIGIKEYEEFIKTDENRLAIENSYMISSSNPTNQMLFIRK